MSKVVILGTSIVIVVYCICAIFGYLTWAGSINEPVLASVQNILYMDYKGNVLFSIATISLMFAVFAASPMCVLPAKDSYEGFTGKKLDR